MKQRLDLTFISPRFLLPADSGGKIRTTQILRGLKGGAFRVTLTMPSAPESSRTEPEELTALCDRLVTWERGRTSPLLRSIKRAAWLTHENPVPVVSDWSSDGAAAVERVLDEQPDVVVFDFPHSAVLSRSRTDVPSVMFTHNVEAEIFHRHWQVSTNPLYRLIWRNQYEKMRRYERDILSCFDMIVAVSARDCSFFATNYGLCTPCRVIPTGVDTEYFQHRFPHGRNQVVFCGSMDWLANIDAIEFFFDTVWPIVRREVPQARMRVVGRTPPSSLVTRIRSAAPEWEFTGFVEDVRDHVAGADAFVIPLRIGGGTRIKAFEAMAMGCPVVSTTVGVEGLPVENGAHYLHADRPSDFAACVVSLLRERARREGISTAARKLVQERYGFQLAAEEFERICLDTIAAKRRRVSAVNTE